MNKIYLLAGEYDTEYTPIKARSIRVEHSRNSFVVSDLFIEIDDDEISVNNFSDKLKYYRELIKSVYYSVCIPNIFDNTDGNCMIGEETSMSKFNVEIDEYDKIKLTIQGQISKYDISDEYPQWLLGEIRNSNIEELLKEFKDK